MTRRPMFLMLFCLLPCLAVGPVLADETVHICYNYGCASEATVSIPEERLMQWGGMLELAQDEASEREELALVIGRMHAFAGGQTPIWADRGANYDDDYVDGRMDCIDHTATTGNFLALLERRGLLRFHELKQPLERGFFLPHRSARIAVKAAPHEEYLVDTWFYDNGRPAVIMPRETWMAGGDPRRRRWAINGH